MKWGSHRDKELNEKLGKIADHASDEGMTGTASKIESVMKEAANQGHFTDDHLETLADHADAHDQKARAADRGSAQEEFHTHMAEQLGDAIDEYHDNEPPGESKPIFGDRFMKDKGKESSSVHVSPKDQEPTPKEGYVDKRYTDMKSGVEARNGWPDKQRRMHRKLAKKSAPRVMESNRQRFPREAAIDLKEFYGKSTPERNSGNGWKNGVSFTPTAPKAQNEEVNLIIKEF